MGRTLESCTKCLAALLTALWFGWSGWVWAGGQAGGAKEADGVWVLSRSLSKGSVLGPGDLARKPLPAGGVPAGAVADPSPLLGMRAVRTLQAGSLLRADQFKPEAILRKGQKVEIILEKGGLKIVAPGEALEEGGFGQRIRVLNVSSRQVVLARVENAGGVRVEF